MQLRHLGAIFNALASPLILLSWLNCKLNDLMNRLSKLKIVRVEVNSGELCRVLKLLTDVNIYSAEHGRECIFCGMFIYSHIECAVERNCCATDGMLFFLHLSALICVSWRFR
jgi:hypothetical protein